RSPSHNRAGLRGLGGGRGEPQSARRPPRPRTVAVGRDVRWAGVVAVAGHQARHNPRAPLVPGPLRSRPRRCVWTICGARRLPVEACLGKSEAEPRGSPDRESSRGRIRWATRDSGAVRAPMDDRGAARPASGGERPLLRRDAFGHLLAAYALEGPSTKVIDQAVERTDGATLAYIHRKSLSKPEVRTYEEQLEAHGLRIVREADLPADREDESSYAVGEYQRPKGGDAC